MTDSSHEADLSIDAILTIGVNDHQSEVSIASITAGKSAAEEDPNKTSASFDVDKEDDVGASGGQHGRSPRKRQSAGFPWSHTHDWTSGDPPQQRGGRQCMVCQNWFSSRTNSQGWKIHLSKKHHITAMSLQEQLSQKRSAGRQATMLSMPLPQHVVHKCENAVVNYIIGGDISLHAASEQQFYKLVNTLTNGCNKPPSTRTILRRTVELFKVAQPLLEKFLCSLDTCFSLTMHGWPNCNLKGFYVVTAHWIDTTSGTMKSLLLTILDVSSGTGVGNQVGSALFAYLTDKVGIAFLSRLLHAVADNVSDACAAVTCLFQLVNSHLVSKVLLPSNHIRCANHSVQRGVISILSQVKV
jgi:hypothetical protein